MEYLLVISKNIIISCRGAEVSKLSLVDMVYALKRLARPNMNNRMSVGRMVHLVKLVHLIILKNIAIISSQGAEVCSFSLVGMVETLKRFVGNHSRSEGRIVDFAWVDE